MSRPARLGAAILGCEGLVLGADEAAFFRDFQPFGFILFGRNIDTPEQLRRLTGALRDAVGWQAPIFIDQEGGRVERMGPPHWGAWLPPLEQMATVGPEHGARAMALRYRLIADDLRAVGIDGNCAPLADIATTDTHPVLRNRCYGIDLATVVSAARAVADGLLAGGVLPVLKHIPGHGRATMDSHKALPRVSASAEVLRGSDFAAFRALNDLPLGMSAHIVFEALSSKAATVDPEMIALIRDEIGFDGLLMTDDISMEALEGTVAERGAAALAAGCDVVLHCNGELAEMQDLAKTVGDLNETALARADAALARRGVPDRLIRKDAEAELGRLMEGLAAHG
ncbi:glycoside hydrolase family 3 N-terminal domain-containing protein [Vannielia sp.]|uniref:glycoside hydrolase family 3 N-terminal domain-containing protein n=1 Tax=Vannielia sp. TaxID=2813045 RepID=UPI002604B1A9|nr:glycoside hydrolase family 3 N-terminal domain-containing protein [Vannielia sp.]MDF1872466.1 glycoside hydrolase family 3 N-terminal domain-containing protein [Vannielia sp.]